MSENKTTFFWPNTNTKHFLLELANTLKFWSILLGNLKSFYFINMFAKQIKKWVPERFTYKFKPNWYIIEN